MTMKIEHGAKAPGKGHVSADPSRRPEIEGADSMLRCYNATAWRLEDWFADDLPPATRQKKSPPAPPRFPVVK